MKKHKKIALVTGANKGIGFETATSLLEKGYTVILGVRDPKKGKIAVERLQHKDVSFIQLDSTDEVSIHHAKEYIHETYSRLDVLVNNAGVWLDFGVPMMDVSIQDIDRTFKVNVIGVIATIKHFLPLLKKAPAGRIVNVSSGLASLTQNADPNYEYYHYKSLAYSTSKSALNAVTVLFAYELRNTPIKINAADPGYCATDLNGNTGARTSKQGAKIIVELATLPNDGPSGSFMDEHGEIAW